MRRMSTPPVERAAAGKPRERVFVRVYDMGTTVLTRGVLNWVAQSYGAFHTGVEVYGREWSFGMTLDDKSTGITWNPPAQHADHSFRETLSMGYTSLSPSEVLQLIESMKTEWRGCTYKLLTRNCNHFSDEFCKLLGVSTLPPWVNTLATLGAGVAGVSKGADDDPSNVQTLQEAPGRSRRGRAKPKKAQTFAPFSGRPSERVLVRVYAGHVQAGACRGCHSAVVLYGQEWSFLPSGITEDCAERSPFSHLAETLAMGHTSLSRSQLLLLVDELRMDWSASTYDAKSRNCHHFADAFCQHLGACKLPHGIRGSAPLRPTEDTATGSQGLLGSIWDNTLGIFLGGSEPAPVADAVEHGGAAEDRRAWEAGGQLDAVGGASRGRSRAPELGVADRDAAASGGAHGGQLYFPGPSSAPVTGEDDLLMARRSNSNLLHRL